MHIYENEITNSERINVGILCWNY